MSRPDPIKAKAAFAAHLPPPFREPKPSPNPRRADPAAYLESRVQLLLSKIEQLKRYEGMERHKKRLQATGIKQTIRSFAISNNLPIPDMPIIDGAA